MARREAIRVRGAEGIQKAMRAEVKRIGFDVLAGLKLWLLQVKGDAQEITPVEFGVLTNSAFVDVDVVFRRVVGRIGYTAAHAPFVHEMPPETDWTKPGTGEKFLERAVLKNKGSLLEFIRRKARR